MKIRCAMPPVNGSEFSALKIRDYGTAVKINGWLNILKTAENVYFLRKKIDLKYEKKN